MCWTMRTPLGCFLLAGIVLLGLCSGCGRCPWDSAYLDLSAWLATYALPSEVIALAESDVACLDGRSTLAIPSGVDAFELLALLDAHRPDYIVGREGLVWDGLRGQPWFYERYEPVAVSRRVYPTAVALTLFAYSPSPFDRGANSPAPGEFATDAVVLRGYRLSSTTLTPGLPLYVTMLWDDVPGRDYSGLRATLRLVAESDNREWYRSQASFQPSGLIWDDARLAQRYVVTIPDDLPQADYALRIGLTEQSGRPVPVLGDGDVADQELLLAEVAHPPDVARAPTPTEFAVDYRLDTAQGPIKLVGFDAPSRVQPGEDVRVTLLWTAVGEIADNYKVFIHVLRKDGTLAAQSDGFPVFGFYPTTRWQPGDFIRDEHLIAPVEDLARGDYTLVVGLYIEESATRSPVYDGDGARVPDDRIVLHEFAVR